MFRMEFHSLDAVEEDEDRPRSYTEPGAGSNGYERFRRHSTSSSPPRIYEGRVGKFSSKMQQRVVSYSNGAVQQHTISHLPAVTITRARSLEAATSIPKNWVEVDLIDFSESPKPAPPKSTTTTSAGEQEVIRELVKPFAESVKLTEPPQPVPVIIPDLLSNGVQESIPAPVAVSGSFPGSSPVRVEDLRVRTDSVRSSASARSESARSEDSDTDGSLSGNGSMRDEEKGSPATRSVNKAFNKFMYKKNKGSVPEAKFVKPWDESLLLAHEQVKMDRKAQKEAKAEAKRVAEEAKREAEFQQRELLELANPVPESSLKHHKEHGVRKGIHKLFHIHGPGIHSTTPAPSGAPQYDVRESKLVMPRASMFDTAAAMMSPSSDVALAQIRQGPRPSTKTDLTFATVESNQRDVQPWTMEEYMAKNARLAEWEGRDDDEEFGGIENNQLLNQNFDNTAMDNFDSDSD